VAASLAFGPAMCVVFPEPIPGPIEVRPTVEMRTMPKLRERILGPQPCGGQRAEWNGRHALGRVNSYGLMAVKRAIVARYRRRLRLRTRRTKRRSRFPVGSGSLFGPGGSFPVGILKCGPSPTVNLQRCLPLIGIVQKGRRSFQRIFRRMRSQAEKGGGGGLRL
jgi:hypothetical protein